jgi:hypothetical protein
MSWNSPDPEHQVQTIEQEAVLSPARGKQAASSMSRKLPTKSATDHSPSNRDLRSETTPTTTGNPTEQDKFDEIQWKTSPLAWIGARSQSSASTDQSKASLPPRIVEDLATRLLQLGGTKVCVQFTDESWCELYVQGGEMCPTTSVRVVPGRPSNCHINCATLWGQHKAQYRLATGYALSDDGVWRGHTWLVSLDGEVIETTVPRTSYFGVVFSEKGSEWFARLLSPMVDKEQLKSAKGGS